jgi:hypothetical protein
MTKDEAPTWFKAGAVLLLGGAILASLPPQIRFSRFTGEWQVQPPFMALRFIEKHIPCGYGRVIAAEDTMNKPPEQRDYLLACATGGADHWMVQVVTPERVHSATVLPAVYGQPFEGSKLRL